MEGEHIRREWSKDRKEEVGKEGEEEMVVGRWGGKSRKSLFVHHLGDSGPPLFSHLIKLEARMESKDLKSASCEETLFAGSNKE